MSSRKRERFVLVECYPDETLVNVLGIPYDQIQHARGKGNIANALRNHYTASVGLVDEDPKSTQPRYFSKMEPVKEFNEQGLIVKRDQQNSNHLVMLRPRLEEWIIKEAKNLEVKLEDFGLPSNGCELHKIINIRQDEFKELLKQLKNHKKGGIQKLREILHQLLRG